MSSEEVKLYSKEHPCKGCGSKAQRILSSTNFAFKAPSGKTAGSGVHGQSGSHDLDYPILDKANGRSAEERWKRQAKRTAAREALRKVTGKTAESEAREALAARDKQIRDFVNKSS